MQNVCAVDMCVALGKSVQMTLAIQIFKILTKQNNKIKDKQKTTIKQKKLQQTNKKQNSH